jgi:hypothetical protein
VGTIRAKDITKEPCNWKVEKYVDVGADQEFVSQFFELSDILNAGTIRGAKRKEVNEAIFTVMMDGLTPAFLELRQIRNSVTEDLPALNRFQLYEDFARKLWKSYKDLMQQAIALMDFDLGFLFQKDQQFREGLKTFRELNPRVRLGFEDFLQETREKWQEELKTFRNEFLEHQTSERTAFEKFYRPEYAEVLFNTAWRTIVNILAVLLESRLNEGWILVEQSSDDPGPRWGQRFNYQYLGPMEWK